MNQLLLLVSRFDDQIARRPPSRAAQASRLREPGLARLDVALARDRLAEASMGLEVAEPQQLGELDAALACVLVGLDRAARSKISSRSSALSVLCFGISIILAPQNRLESGSLGGGSPLGYQ